MTETIQPIEGDAPLFTDLLSDQPLIDALHGIGITRATRVQAASLPDALAGHDLIVKAQTGSGKTIAFVVPMLLQLRRNKPENVTHTIILTPTRELAIQIQGVVSSLAPDLLPCCLIGGRSEKQNYAELDRDARVVVGTPGRVLDFLNQRELNLSSCRSFVLDEADEMLGIGFLPDVRAILSRLPKERQGFFFSATINPRVQELARAFLKDYKTIKVESVTESAPEIEHLFCKVDAGIVDKAAAVTTILSQDNSKSVLVFCNSKSDTELLEVFLKRKGIVAARINSDLSQKQREEVMRRFRSGEVRILIGTDIAARGIDVKHLDLVINYAIHDQAETYVHRTGRTGRAGRPGRAISVVGPQDFSAWYNLTKTLSVPFKEISLAQAA